MLLNPVLIKDGHEESAEGFVDLPELEAFLNSNHGEAVCLQNDVDLEVPMDAAFLLRGNCARNMGIKRS